MPWMTITTDTRADFQRAFSHLYIRAPDGPERDVAALFRRGAELVLTPVAAEWMQRVVPFYQLTPCERPVRGELDLLIGSSLCLDPAYVEMSEAERELVHEADHLDELAAAAQRAEYDEMFGVVRGH